jgi:hypothetical protein
MNLKTNISLLVALGLTSAAIAGDEISTRVTIAMVDDESAEELRLELDSDQLGFDLHDMQEGESRSIVDQSGRNILVTRKAEGFTFDVDGKIIEMPLLEGGHHGAIWMGDGEPGDIDVHVLHNARTATDFSQDGVMIVSGRPIDTATRQAIQSLLESAGYDSDVRFIDAQGTDGAAHTFKLIEKRVELLQ